MFLAQWSLVSDKKRLRQEIERRKNMSLTSSRIDEAIRKYKEETNWDQSSKG